MARIQQDVKAECGCIQTSYVDTIRVAKTSQEHPYGLFQLARQTAPVLVPCARHRTDIETQEG